MSSLAEADTKARLATFKRKASVTSIYCSDDDDDDDSEEDEEDLVDDFVPVAKKFLSRGRRHTVMATKMKVAVDWKAPRHQKRKVEKELIEDLLKNIFMFKNLSESELEVCVMAFKRMITEDGQEIITEGDEHADYFYILQEGRIRFEKNKKTVATKGWPAPKGEGSDSDGVIYKDPFFGELGLLYDAPRNASAFSEGECILWALDRTTFKSIIVSSVEKAKKQRIEYLRSVPILQTLTEHEFEVLTDCVKSATYDKGDIIIVEGDEGGEMYIVQEGKVVCTKEGVDGELAVYYNQGSNKSTQLFFGELALLTNENRQATVTAAVDHTVLLSIERKVFKRLLGSLQELLHRNTDLYEKYGDRKSVV